MYCLSGEHCWTSSAMEFMCWLLYLAVEGLFSKRDDKLSGYRMAVEEAKLLNKVWFLCSFSLSFFSYSCCLLISVSTSLFILVPWFCYYTALVKAVKSSKDCMLIEFCLEWWLLWAGLLSKGNYWKAVVLQKALIAVDTGPREEFYWEVGWLTKLLFFFMKLSK